MMPIRLTRAVKAILIACVAIFLIQLLGRQFGLGIADFFALIPGEFINHLHLWQIFTYPFVHVDPLQLVLNLLMLAFIGSELEAIWGTRKFVQFYLFCTVVAGGVYLVLHMIVSGSGLYTPMVGSNAPVFGLLVAYGILYKEQVMLFMMLFPMKAKHFIWILAAVEFLSSISYGRNGLASLAELGGMGAGYIYLYGRATFAVLRKQKQRGGWNMTRQVKKRKSAGHLKLVKNDSEDDPKTWH